MMHAEWLSLFRTLWAPYEYPDICVPAAALTTVTRHGATPDVLNVSP